MVTKSNLQLTISLTEPGLDDEDLQAQVQNLLPQLKEVDGVEDADLVAVENAPQNTKALGGFSLGTFKAIVNPALIKPVFEFLSRFSNKTFEMKIEAYGEKFELKANNKEDFIFITQETEKFLKNAKNRQNSKDGEDSTADRD
ncbi:MAG: sugar ABC transporter permease [Gloeotrichia echinulata CP02]|jgi:hypothetical protein